MSRAGTAAAAAVATPSGELEVQGAEAGAAVSPVRGGTEADAALSQVRGDFEIHLTASAIDADVAALAEHAAARGLKFAHIVLARGETASQPMLTARRSGTFDSVLRDAGRLVDETHTAGFDVTRVKVEAAPNAEGVPLTTAEAELLPGETYFEHHVKLLLDSGVDEAALVALVMPHAAHVSRNARRVRADGRSERFVTQRCRGVGTDSAVSRLARLTDDLTEAEYRILSVEREFVVHDSAPSIDAGWIEGEGKWGRTSSSGG